MILKQAWATQSVPDQSELQNVTSSQNRNKTHLATRATPAHQHEVDIEGEDLAAHVDTEGLWEVLAQVGKGTCCALEVGAGDFHALDVKDDHFHKARIIPTLVADDTLSSIAHPYVHLHPWVLPPQTRACP